MRRSVVSALWLASIAATSTLDSQAQPARRPPRTGGIPGTELAIVATDFQFQAPEQVDAGLVNIRLFNRGQEMHHVLVIKVDRLDRISQIARELRENNWSAPWMHPLGGPESVGPGGVASASMVLEPGRYVLACIVASPTSHRQHFMDGMIRELSVVKPPTPVAMTLPPAEVSMKLFEWSFTIAGPLHAGRRTIRIDNIGKFEHHAWFVRIYPGRTVAQAVAWAENPLGPAPFEPVGGTTGLGAGRSVNVTLDLSPGEYAVLCTLFNPLSKKTHSAHGMFMPLTITD
jgi:hypothetical protein